MPERPIGRAPRLRAGRVGNEGKRKFATLESFLKLPGVPKPAAGATVGAERQFYETGGHGLQPFGRSMP